MISVYIDANVWNLLFDHKIDLTEEFPSDRYCLCMTREAEFEIPPIPEEKADLKEFISSTVARAVKTVPIFGFYDDSLPADQQRYGGFNTGGFASEAELAFMSQQRGAIGMRMKAKSKLYPNEADLALASRAFESIVLTLDSKKGPLNTAYQQGGLVVFLDRFLDSGLSLREYVDTDVLSRS